MTDKSLNQAEICLIKERLIPVICPAVLASSCSVCRGESKITAFEPGDSIRKEKDRMPPLCMCG